jgi:FixJ family two-component response regulator
MKAEAVDLIEKPCGDEALIDAIESAMKRGVLRMTDSTRTSSDVSKVSARAHPM